MKNEMRYYETRRERNDALPFYLYKIPCGESTAIYAHWHEEMEIIYAYCDGTITVDYNTISFKKGDIIFVNKDMLHHANTTSKGFLYAMVFDYSFLEFKRGDSCQMSIFDKLKGRKLFFPVTINEHSKCYEGVRACLYEAMRYYYGAVPGRELKIKCSLYEIVFLLYSSGLLCEAGEIGGYEHSQLTYVKTGIQFMENNLHRQLTVDEIAQSVSISKFHFIKVFKQITGVTPIIYLRDLRVKKSVDYLEDGYSVTQASLLCGFNNLSYFIRAFREQYNVSPKEYQKSTR